MDHLHGTSCPVVILEPRQGIRHQGTFCSVMDGYGGMGMTRHIPLVCTVCPDSPRFSDVSHLLTHIASKGHLHHETQTKLKAHQDLVSAVALQHYEQWYRDNGIEALLVERMKAKQVKEALKGRHPRVSASTNSASSIPKPKKRTRRTTNDTGGFLAQDYGEPMPIYPALFSEENDSEIPDDMLQSSEMMSLKGQIWPGMGKMDLANDDMKRTRNQRKPKSAIDRMRRTSEGIKPTQVVMTSEFEVERVKGVYDSSSPILGQEEATPPPTKRVARARKKREPLADLSVNTQLRHPDQENGRLFPRAARQSRNGTHRSIPGYDLNFTQRPSILPHGGFRDGNSPLNVYNDRMMESSSHQHSKIIHYDHQGMNAINPISQPAMAAQMMTPRDSFSYSRDSPSGLPDLRHASFPSDLSQRPDTPGSLSASIFGGSSRLAMALNNHFSAYDRFQYHDTHPITPKDDDYFAGQVSLLNSSPNFMNLSENNPLLSQDRTALKNYQQSPSSKTHSQENSFSRFKPINYGQEIAESNAQSDSHEIPTDDIKVETQLCDIVHSSLRNDKDDPNFDVEGTWTAESMLDGLPADLGHEDPGV